MLRIACKQWLSCHGCRCLFRTKDSNKKGSVNLIDQYWMWHTEYSSNHLPSLFFKVPPLSRCCLWAVSQINGTKTNKTWTLGGPAEPNQLFLPPQLKFFNLWFQIYTLPPRLGCKQSTATFQHEHLAVFCSAFLHTPQKNYNANARDLPFEFFLISWTIMILKFSNSFWGSPCWSAAEVTNHVTTAFLSGCCFSNSNIICPASERSLYLSF